MILLVAAATPLRAQDPSTWHVDVETPENLGYTIGDLIHHRVRLFIADPYRLDESALPRPSRLSSWLELKSVELEADRGWGSRTYRLGLTYQIFNTTGAVRGAATPPVSLTVAAGTDTFPVVIPAWGFFVLPVAAPEEIPPGTLPVLQPSRPPGPVDLRARQARIALLSAALLVAVVYLVHLNGSVPFFRRGDGPFARAHRRLKRLRHRPFGDPARREAFRHLHAAFNETAGHVVFAADLDAFFSAQPRFRRIRPSVESFYTESWQEFFTREAGTGPAAESVDPLLRLAKRFRDAERGLA